MSCTKCRLHQTCRSVQIPGRGADQPKYLFVGQAPGEQEDEEGRCFVGPSGQLLTQAIKVFKLTPARLTNLVRCFPPGDRNPMADEIRACTPYLMEEIEKTKPEIIIALGNHALKALTGKNGIMDYSGHIVGQLNGSQVFALAHPSYVLRDTGTSRLRHWEMDLKALQRLGSGQKTAPVKSERLSAQDAFSILKENTGMVTFDFETNGKPAMIDGVIRCASFNALGKNFYVVQDLERLLKWFVDTDLPKCAHNGIFERHWCMVALHKEPKNLIYDTYLMHYLLDETAGHGLDVVAAEYLGVESWKIYFLMQEKGWTWETVPMEILGPYSCKDSHYTAQLVNPLLKKLKEQKLMEVYNKHLLPISKLCARMEVRGAKIDREYCNKWGEKYQEQCTKCVADMRMVTGLDENFNPDSPMQVRKVLKKLNLKTSVKTKGRGEMSVGKEALKPLEGKHPFVDALLKWSELDTVRRNYLEKFPKFVDVAGILHPSYTPAFQKTGRISSTNPPLSNMPKDPNVSGMVVSRYENGWILSNDYKQLELHLVASESGEQKMIDIFEKGGDLHDETAKFMFGPQFTDKHRKIAKNINFGVVYGISDYSLSRKFNVPIDVAMLWVDRWKQTYPKVYAWMAQQHKTIVRQGWISSRFGNLRRLPDAKSRDEKMVARTLRQAGNFPIQSLGAYVTNMAAVMIDNCLVRTGYKSLVFLDHHDAVLVDAHPDELDTAKAICRKIMEDEMQKRCPWLKVRLKIDQVASKRWGGENGK